MSTVLANPAKMIAHGAPRVIHNDAELAAYTEALFQLTSLPRPTSYEAEAIELLTLLVERYEQADYPIPAADPVSVVRFLMEQQHLTQRDLVTEFGFESAVSMFLAGQRKLTLRQVQRLSARFQLPADIFISTTDTAPRHKWSNVRRKQSAQAKNAEHAPEVEERIRQKVAAKGMTLQPRVRRSK